MWRSLGRPTTTPGTLARVTKLEDSPTAPLYCHSMAFQQWPTNTGRIYILDRSDGDVATGLGVVAILAVPTRNSLPAASDTVSNAANAFNIAEYYFDVEVSGEGPVVSATVL